MEGEVHYWYMCININNLNKRFCKRRFLTKRSLDPRKTDK